MKTYVTALATLVLAVGLMSCALAYETDFDDLRQYDRSLPGWKLGRGLTNILFGGQEIFAQSTNGALQGQYAGAYSEGLHGSAMGSLNGFVGGLCTGTVAALRRTTLGFMEVLTFWKPEYGPTMDPTYGTRCWAWGKQDYYDPDPFWYMGPDK